jgi:hypothetical protein
MKVFMNFIPTFNLRIESFLILIKMLIMVALFLNTYHSYGQNIVNETYIKDDSSIVFSWSFKISSSEISKDKYSGKTYFKTGEYLASLNENTFLLELDEFISKNEKHTKFELNISGETDGQPIKPNLFYRGEFGDIVEKSVFNEKTKKNEIVQVLKDDQITNRTLSLLRIIYINTLLDSTFSANSISPCEVKYSILNHSEISQSRRNSNIKINVSNPFNEKTEVQKKSIQTAPETASKRNNPVYQVDKLEPLKVKPIFNGTSSSSKNDLINSKIKQFNLDTCNQPPKTYLVFIGISDYSFLRKKSKMKNGNSEIGDLRYGHHDAITLYTLFSESEKKMGRNFECFLLTNNLATRKNIIGLINSLLVKANCNDNIYIFFSGHGLGGKVGQESIDKVNRTFFLPFDYIHYENIQSDPKAIEKSNAIDLIQLNSLILKSNFKHNIIFVDACRSDYYKYVVRTSLKDKIDLDSMSLISFNPKILKTFTYKIGNNFAAFKSITEYFNKLLTNRDSIYTIYREIDSTHFDKNYIDQIKRFDYSVSKSIIIFATEYNNISTEDYNLKSGLFTHYIKEIITKSSSETESYYSNKDEYLNINEIYNYLLDNIPNDTSRNIANQRPICMPEHIGEDINFNILLR